MRGLAMLLVVGCACGGRLEQAAGEVSASPNPLDFGRAFVGYPASATLTLTNGSRAPRTVRLSLPPGFTTGASEVRLQGGEARAVLLSLAAAQAGPVAGTLELSGDAQGEVQLVADAEAPQACSGSGPCRAVRFDPLVGACVSDVTPDGAACSDACVESGSCQQGICVGSEKSCDDGDPCTTDACGAQGCVHLDASAWCPAPSDPCQAALCDPKTGCGAAAVADGTSCGFNDCSTAHVCIAGKCTERPAPSGSECAPASACQGAGLCQAGQCVQPAAATLQPKWTYLAPGGSWVSGELAADDAGNLYFSELSQVQCPECEVNAPGTQCRIVSLDPQGALRWARVYYSSCEGLTVDTELGQLYLLADTQHRVAALALADGAERWSSDLYAALQPQFTTRPSRYAFAASQLVLGPAQGPLFVSAGLTTSTDSWVAGLDRVSGLLGFSAYYPDALGPLAGDPGGVAFTARDPSAQTALVRLSATGQPLLDASLAPDAPSQLALSMGGDVLLSGGISPASGRYELLGGALRVGTGLWAGLAVGDPQVLWTTGGPPLPPIGVPANSLFAVDWATGNARAAFSFTSSQQPSDLFVTDRSTALATVQETSGIVPATSLLEADLTGQLLASCPLAQATSGGAVLLDGVLYAPTGIGVVAYALPADRPAPVGWSAHGGNARRDGRAR